MMTRPFFFEAAILGLFGGLFGGLIGILSGLGAAWVFGKLLGVSSLINPKRCPQNALICEEKAITRRPF